MRLIFAPRLIVVPALAELIAERNALSVVTVTEVATEVAERSLETEEAESEEARFEHEEKSNAETAAMQIENFDSFIFEITPFCLA